MNDLIVTKILIDNSHNGVYYVSGYNKDNKTVYYLRYDTMDEVLDCLIRKNDIS